MQYVCLHEPQVSDDMGGCSGGGGWSNKWFSSLRIYLVMPAQATPLTKKVQKKGGEKGEKKG